MAAPNDSNPAVLACHLQREFLENPRISLEANRRQVVENARRILDAARTGSAPRVLIRIAWRSDGSNLLANTPMLAGAQSAGILLEDQPGAALVDDLGVSEGDITLTHHRLNPFFGTDLDTILQSRGVETVIVFGVTTDVVVQATVFAAADLGYRVLVVEDACSAITSEAHDAAMQTLAQFGDVVSVDDVLGQLVAI